HQDEAASFQIVGRLVDFGGQKIGIGALDDQDRVFAGRFDEDGGDAARLAGNLAHMARIDTELVQVEDGGVGEYIVAHTRDHHYIRAKTRGSYRLIGALAAAADFKCRRFQRFAGAWHAVHIGDEVHHVGADHSDLSGHETFL